MSSSIGVRLDLRPSAVSAAVCVASRWGSNPPITTKTIQPTPPAQAQPGVSTDVSQARAGRFTLRQHVVVVCLWTFVRSPLLLLERPVAGCRSRLCGVFLWLLDICASVLLMLCAHGSPQHIAFVAVPLAAGFVCCMRVLHSRH